MQGNISKPFRIDSRTIGEDEKTIVLTLHGFLDAHTVNEFETKGQDLLEAGIHGVILDTEGLDFISSAGLGSLMNLSKKLRKGGGDLILLQPSERILAILDLMSLTKVLRFAPNPEEALELLQEQNKRSEEG